MWISSSFINNQLYYKTLLILTLFIPQTNISMKFFLNESNFIEEFKTEESTHEENKVVQITEISSISKTIELLSKDWFKEKILNSSCLKQVILRINEEIHEDFNENFQLFTFDDEIQILITFQSTIGSHASKIFWKNKDSEKLYSVYIEENADEEVEKFVRSFIAEEMENNKTGILHQFKYRTKIVLHQIGDDQGISLLQQAVAKLNLNLVEKLLKYEFDADDVIDIAWKKFEDSSEELLKQQSSDVVLILLKSNSRLPNGFNYSKAHKNIQDFIDYCETLHDFASKNNFKAIKLEMDKEPNLIHFYDRNNKSLLAHALQERKMDILDLLDRGITTGRHENLDEVYSSLWFSETCRLRNQHKVNAKEELDSHLMALRLRSRIGNNDKLANKRWISIEESLEVINTDQFCSKILKTAAEFKKLKIFFDFKHDSTYYFDPATSSLTHGSVDSEGTIFIGAKYLLDDLRKSEVIGVLAHELMHLATLVSFMNPIFDPFPMGESEVKRIYQEVVMPECEVNKTFEKIIGNVYKSYDKDVQNSEMIVTVPQMLMHYRGNEERINELKRTYPQLFKYAEEIVEPELDRALPILKILEDENKDIKFLDLTEAMKAKILNLDLKFQGEITRFNDVVGYDTEVLELLTPENIRSILMKDMKLEIGVTCTLNLKYGLIERNFVESSHYEEVINMLESSNIMIQVDPKVKHLSRTFDQINDEVQGSKLFLLADHAGTGKTTIFKDMTKKLKKVFKDYWVSFVNLRKSASVFEKFKSKIDTVDNRKVLLELVTYKSELEAKIFTKLFAKGKVMLLLDGFDEISPKYTQVLLKMLTVLTQKPLKNYLWISTRPHHAESLYKIFQTPIFKLLPIAYTDRVQFITKVLYNKGISSKRHPQKYQEILSDINSCIYSYIFDETPSNILEGSPKKQLIDNPLMIEIIAELYAENKEIASSTFGLYSAIIERQKEKVDGKVSSAELNPVRNKLDIWGAHAVLALIVVVGDDPNYNLKDLSIMKKWSKDKKNWTSDMIQRYGFVIVDLKNLQLDSSSIDFMHRTYAEYFVAKFLIDFLFDDNDDVSEEEVERRFKLLDVVMKDHHVVSDFIFGFIKKSDESQELDETVRDLITKKIEEIHSSFEDFALMDYDERCQSFENYARISCKDKELSNLLWQIEEDEDIFKKFALKSLLKPSLLSHLAEISFGSSWAEKFNKNEQNLISNKEVEDLRDGSDDILTLNEINLVKICDWADKNANELELATFYENFDLESIIHDKVMSEISARIRRAVDGKIYIHKFLTSVNFSSFSAEYFENIFIELEEACDQNRETIRNFLFHTFQGYFSPLIKALDSNNPEIFKIVKDFYVKYKNSWKEIQDILLQSWSLLHSGSFFSFYKELRELIQEAFGTDRERIAEEMKDHYLNSKRIHMMPVEYFDELKKMLEYIFEEDLENLDKILAKIKIL